MEKLFRNIGTGQPIYDPIPNNNPGAGISPQSPYVNESFVSSNPFSNPRADMNNQIAVQNQATVTNGPQIPYQSPPQTGIQSILDPMQQIQIPQLPAMPAGTAGPIMTLPSSPNVPTFDFNPNVSNNLPETNDTFGVGSNPQMNNPIMNNPITPMPSMSQQPSFDMGNFTSELMSGIGNLFEQYFPQQGGSTQFNQPGAQPTFDATGNSVSGDQTQSNQVFGNMITPDFGSY